VIESHPCVMLLRFEENDRKSLLRYEWNISHTTNKSSSVLVVALL